MYNSHSTILLSLVFTFKIKIFKINYVFVLFHFYIYKLPILISPKTRENTPFYKVFISK